MWLSVIAVCLVSPELISAKALETVWSTQAQSSPSPSRPDPITETLLRYYDRIAIREWQLSMVSVSCEITEGSQDDLPALWAALLLGSGDSEAPRFAFTERLKTPSYVGICRRASDSELSVAAAYFDGTQTLVVRWPRSEAVVQDGYRNGGMLVWPHDLLGFYAGSSMAGHIRNAVSKGVWRVEADGHLATGFLPNSLSGHDPMEIQFEVASGLPVRIRYPSSSMTASTTLILRNHQAHDGILIPRSAELVLSGERPGHRRTALTVGYEMAIEPNAITPNWLIERVVHRGILNTAEHQWISGDQLDVVLERDLMALAGMPEYLTDAEGDLLSAPSMSQPADRPVEWPGLADVLNSRMAESGYLDADKTHCTHLAMYVFLRRLGKEEHSAAEIMQSLPGGVISAASATRYLASRGVDSVLIEADRSNLALLKGPAIVFSEHDVGWHASYAERPDLSSLWSLWAGPRQLRTGKWREPKVTMLVARSEYHRMFPPSWVSMGSTWVGIGLIVLAACLLCKTRLTRAARVAKSGTLSCMVAFAIVLAGASCSPERCEDPIKLCSESLSATIGRQEVRRIAIPVTNQSRVSRTLTMARSDCSCVQPAIESVVVPPDETVDFLVDISDKDGRTHVVTIKLIDSFSRGTYTVPIAVSGWQSIWVTPKNLTWRSKAGTFIERAMCIHLRPPELRGKFAWERVGDSLVEMAVTSEEARLDEVRMFFTIQIPTEPGLYNQSVVCRSGLDHVRFSISVFSE